MGDVAIITSSQKTKGWDGFFGWLTILCLALCGLTLAHGLAC